ncbi:MAG: acyltransferase [Hydrogenophaga sp.]|jgi:peptidoglycan/LPS O-acetylase OafA/YrhL|uniref:acyltransferase family protein n=1 Tax=Hydrogenophaga sp. TaxID=1904254 RepID=UPI00272F3DE6|nr:acyltransferase [Hydrogenophaga sp.]MDP2405883.1 acyltransferase [Hydrogenophaga sp.]MDZ4175358.1 acyltransferase [Hydrogenophaga sp.]
MSFNPSLHGLRGLIAVSILLFHWKTNYPELARQFQAIPIFGANWDLFYFINGGGIHWFFVLSGYQIAASLWQQPMNCQHLWLFGKRRFLRIFPVVWVHLAILMAVTYYILGSLSFLQWRQLLGNSLLWFNPLPLGVAPYNGVMWTLSVELLFYLTLPILLLIYRGSNIWFVIFLGAATAIAYRWGIWLQHDGALRHDSAALRVFPGLLFLFIAGFAINHFSPNPAQGLRNVLFALSAGAYFLWRYPVQNHAETPWLVMGWDLGMGLLIAFMVSLLIKPVYGLGWLSSRPLMWIGNLSFGIYLWHLPALRWLPRLAPGPWNTAEGSALALMICLFLTFTMASLTYFLIEKPLLFKRHKRD